MSWHMPCTNAPANGMARWTRRGSICRPCKTLLVPTDQKTVVQSFLMLTTVQPSASA
jgi:hypothetical protein